MGIPRELTRAMVLLRSMWMYAMDEDFNTASTIRIWMGDFDGIRNVAKQMARMGQCLSSTEQAVRVKPSHVQYIPDLVDGYNPISKKPYVFSDGVGMMSQPLALEVRTRGGIR